MNLTDADLNQFFASKLANLKPDVQGFIPTQFDSNCESYLQDVFEPEPIVSQEDMISSLVEIWQRQGLDALAALEPDFRRIAQALRATDQETQQVSNFIYAMY
ncbi:hypothetical protein [Caballeronia insecticola]|uniref:Uncharacterized protein n=1 Tax=Caballeronia insecticola TaxID=758793 RepID=R4WWH2_9BURK|nr:hypothetical protein [Caballeronia insecticola]BAN25450.1 hypothetical protein BRPE64_BCDS07890 [Caballeronia insecticola]